MSILKTPKRSILTQKYDSSVLCFSVNCSTLFAEGMQMLRLKELREGLGHTQAKMAEMIGCLQTTYQRYESGDRTPSYDVLLRISDVFDVSVDYLLGKTDNI